MPDASRFHNFIYEMTSRDTTCLPERTRFDNTSASEPSLGKGQHERPASTLIEKRTQRGHTGQSTERSAARDTTLWRERARAACAFVTDNRFWLPSQRALPLQPSSPCFVPCVRAVSVSQ